MAGTCPAMRNVLHTASHDVSLLFSPADPEDRFDILVMLIEDSTTPWNWWAFLTSSSLSNTSSYSFYKATMRLSHKNLHPLLPFFNPHLKYHFLLLQARGEDMDKKPHLSRFNDSVPDSWKLHGQYAHIYLQTNMDHTGFRQWSF